MRLGQRVVVHVGGGKAERYKIDGGALGTVRRLLISSDGAWVELDERQANDRIHPFPSDDPTRARHTLAYPEEVSTKAAQGNGNLNSIARVIAREARSVPACPDGLSAEGLRELASSIRRGEHVK